MSREHLIAVLTEGSHPGVWNELFKRSLECSETWLSWLVLYDNGEELGYAWAPSLNAARAICIVGGQWLAEVRLVDMDRMLSHEVARMAEEECEDVDWDDLLN